MNYITYIIYGLDSAKLSYFEVEDGWILFSSYLDISKSQEI